MVDRIVGIVIALLGAGYWYLADNLPEPLLRQPVGPEVFPKLLAIGLVVLGVALLASTFVKAGTAAPRKAEEAAPDEDAVAAAARAVAEVLEQDAGTQLDYRTVLLAASGLVLYALAYERLGFLLSTFVFMVYETAVMETRRGHWLRTVLAAAVLSAGIYFLFVKLLDVVLPKGLLG
ncbi:tripartite tricarboxylate transporter TctB family protein [Caldinitratiruptor microaerophilus]|uniref:Membrane protein n=1 Tax=Caldinitratiruptor microaerophilus TaxID=671077 RepID=A0AA35G757_9FIRM|nr:tripartite tricarboxylate transporter TctB family protein [Caldinitratiruptor microaerophilus]BDG59465.1 membrane protein [Caldinitratiruptor microaerophilus]